jgi:hypothetical protein
MLALGILTVHVALDTRAGFRIEAGLKVSESEELEYVVTFEAIIVVLERIMGPSIPLDPAPVGCAYPFPLATVYGGLVIIDGTGTLLITDKLVRAVMLEYGAEWLD